MKKYFLLTFMIDFLSLYSVEFIKPVEEQITDDMFNVT